MGTLRILQRLIYLSIFKFGLNLLDVMQQYAIILTSMKMYKGQHVVLRPFEKEDLEQYRTWVNDAKIAHLIDRATPVTKREHENWYVDLVDSNNATVFAIATVDDDKYVGNVWLWDINWRHRKAEVRILIGDIDYHSKGFGAEAINLISKYAYDKLNLNRLYAYIIATNNRAEKAFKKAGFAVEGILRKDRYIDGVYQDVLLMAMLRNKE